MMKNETANHERRELKGNMKIYEVDYMNKETGKTEKRRVTIPPREEQQCRIVAVKRLDDGEVYHYRATEQWIKWAQRDAMDGSKLVGVWTDAEYIQRFGREYVSDSTSDQPAETTQEWHSRHIFPNEACPLCCKPREN